MAKKSADTDKAPAAPAAPPFLRKYYQDEVIKELRAKHGYANIHQVPKLEKIVINSAFRADVEKSAVAEIQRDIALIAGQQAIVTKARKSISNFKVRQGMPLGVKVTLRGDRMWDFLMRLVAVALPAIRDFQGVPTRLDGAGNYTLGISDHSIFPEINVDTNKRTLGMDICIITTASTDEEARSLLRALGMPFRKSAKEKAEAEAAAARAKAEAEAATPA
jgi:large subunit ribosomal protein L5